MINDILKTKPELYLHEFKIYELYSLDKDSKNEGKVVFTVFNLGNPKPIDFILKEGKHLGDLPYTIQIRNKYKNISILPTMAHNTRCLMSFITTRRLK